MVARSVTKTRINNVIRDLASASNANSHLGVMLVKEGDQTRECYVLMCTCPATRMVHFELTEGMTTEDFLQALKRVMNRRGFFQQIHLDNQTSFKRARRIILAPT